MRNEAEMIRRLEALTDPNRLSLMDELFNEQAPLDSAELGRRVRPAKVALAYHLGMLQGAGLIKEVEPGSNVWVVDDPTVDLSTELSRDPRFKLLHRRVEQALNERRAERAQRWALNRTKSEWAEWTDHTIGRDYVMSGMTPEDLDELDRRLDELAQEFKARGATREDGETITLTLIAHPLRGAD